MNFSSSLMHGMGISLGSLELATDYLYANTDLYEPDLTEVKTIISNKTITNKLEKPIKPKVTRESIINKFSILPNKKPLIKDTVIQSSSILEEDEDFSFDFDDIGSNSVGEGISSDEDLIIANELYNRLNNITSKNDSYYECYDNDATLCEIDISDLLEEDDDNISELLEESEEDSKRIENEINEIDISDLLEEDDDNISELLEESEEDSKIIDSEIDEIDISDLFEAIEDDISDLMEEDDISDLMEEDDISDLMEEDENKKISIDTKQLKDIEVESLKTTSKKYDKENDIKTKNKSGEYKAHKEIAELKKQIVKMSNQMTQLQKNSKNNNSSENNEVISNKGVKHEETTSNKNNYERYNIMSIDKLYIVVKSYMTKNGVSSKPIDILSLNNQFGASNVNRLIKKSYLIKTGKGVTMGR